MKNTANCLDSITKTVAVNPQPIASFIINKATQCFYENNFVFTDNSTNTTGSSTRLWRFDNNDTNSSVTVSKSYTIDGTYSVKLIVKSGINCADSTSKTFTLLPKLTIGNILGNVNPTSRSTPYTYSVLSQPNIIYNWTTLNGTIQNGQGTNTVNVVWPTTGTGSLKAKITHNNGCVDSTNLSLNITSVGINNLNLENDLNVYPNPTKNNITITNKTNLVGKNYIIENLVGQTVLSGKLNLDETIVNLETLQSGMYFLSIDGLNKQSIKVIKE